MPEQYDPRQLPVVIDMPVEPEFYRIAQAAIQDAIFVADILGLRWNRHHLPAA